MKDTKKDLEISTKRAERERMILIEALSVAHEISKSISTQEYEFNRVKIPFFSGGIVNSLIFNVKEQKFINIEYPYELESGEIEQRIINI